MSEMPKQIYAYPPDHDRERASDSYALTQYYRTHPYIRKDMADDLAKALEYCAQLPGSMPPQSQAQYRIAQDALLKYREIV